MKPPLKIVGFVFFSMSLLILGCLGSTPSSDSEGSDETTELRSWIDTHAHPTGINGDCFTESCLSAVLAVMDAHGARKAILMHPPSPAGGGSDEAETAVRTAAATYPDRFFYGAGGSRLNAMIQQAPDSESIPPPLQQDFDDAAQGLIDTGQVVVFGETAALHLSYEEGHAYEETPPNAPIFLHLADLAASYGVPVDIHMDTVEETMTTPTFFTEASPLNPSELPANIPPFEELLDHNTEAQIVWVHVGRDTTGDMTAELVGQLLAAHSNLTIQIHPTSVPLSSPTAILDETGTIRTEWLGLLQTYPDRAVVGSDVFFSDTGDLPAISGVENFLQQLPEDLATQIGCTNPVAIYNLSAGCQE